MSEQEVLEDPRYIRGKWMLDNQITGPDQLIQFWAVFGKYAV